MKAKDKDGLPLIEGNYYYGFRKRKGIYQLVIADEKISTVKKVMGSRGAPVLNPKHQKPHSMGNMWLRCVSTPLDNSFKL